MYYIYAHTRNDTNQIFYIGKDQGNRACDESFSRRGMDRSEIS